MIAPTLLPGSETTRILDEYSEFSIKIYHNNIIKNIVNA